MFALIVVVGLKKDQILPKEYLFKYPLSDKRIFKPVDEKVFQEILSKNRNIKPSKR